MSDDDNDADDKGSVTARVDEDNEPFNFLGTIRTFLGAILRPVQLATRLSTREDRCVSK